MAYAIIIHNWKTIYCLHFHNSSAVVTFVNLWTDWIIKCIAIANRFSIIFQLWALKRLWNEVHYMCLIDVDCLCINLWMINHQALCHFNTSLCNTYVSCVLIEYPQHLVVPLVISLFQLAIHCDFSWSVEISREMTWAIFEKIAPGPRFTNSFSIANHIRWKFCFTHLNSNTVIATKFCARDDSCAVVACAKIFVVIW